MSGPAVRIEPVRNAPAPSLRDWLDRLGAHGRLAVARPGVALRLAMAASSKRLDGIKATVFPAPDVNIHDAAEVEWAVATRCQPDRDLVIVAHAQGTKLDPSTDNGVGAKLGIDATIPLDAPPMRYRRIRVPGEDTVDLTRALDASLASDWRRALGR
jgi:2,5-furandicarboxylate decarboxylase 1